MQISKKSGLYQTTGMTCSCQWRWESPKIKRSRVKSGRAWAIRLKPERFKLFPEKWGLFSLRNGVSGMNLGKISISSTEGEHACRILESQSQEWSFCADGAAVHLSSPVLCGPGDSSWERSWVWILSVLILGSEIFLCSCDGAPGHCISVSIERSRCWFPQLCSSACKFWNNSVSSEPEYEILGTSVIPSRYPSSRVGWAKVDLSDILVSPCQSIPGSGPGPGAELRWNSGATGLEIRARTISVMCPGAAPTSISLTWTPKVPSLAGQAHLTLSGPVGSGQEPCFVAKPFSP